MIQVRPAEERGHADFGWLNSRHSFSFGRYYDPQHMGFGPLRVINDDLVEPGKGFGTHDHADMEIISYVVDGALEHKDSLGTGSVIRPGDVQRMSAGRGIRHSEFNPSKTDPVRFLQIWVLPELTGIEPGYEQKNFSDADKTGRLRLVASKGGRDGSLSLHQNVDLYASILKDGGQVSHRLAPGRRAWIQVVSGTLEVNGTKLGHGDGAAIAEETELAIAGAPEAEFLLFDMI